MGETKSNFIIAHKGITQFAVCMIFSLCLIYGLIQAKYDIHKFPALYKVIRKLNYSSSNYNSKTACVYENICYNKTDKKCFHIKEGVSYHPVKMTELHQLESNNDLKNTVKSTNISINKTISGKEKAALCNRFITIGPYKGRIGNQMFEIASLLGTAYKYDLMPLIPANYPINQYFNLPNLVKKGSNKLSNAVACVSKKSAVYYNCAREIGLGKNVTMYGYLQSWKYFIEANDIIRSVFKLKQSYLVKAQNFLSRVSLDGYKRVCIHVRRGDITGLQYQKAGYVIAGLDYIEKAKEFYRKKYSKVQFLVVSDDKSWCRKHIKGVNISTLSEPGDELALMALSDDVVITVGTFGWWGAWLSGGTTVYNNKYPRKGSALASRIKNEDFYIPNWIGMS